MHELSLAHEVLRLVEDAARREAFRRVSTLKLEAGVLSGVEVHALRFALESIAPGTCLEGATIDIDEPMGRAWCGACAAEVPITSRADPCPQCGGYALQVRAGDTLRVVDLVVVDE